jgi:LmbE family N-acetylglucosaminyl deacetylase
MTVMVIASHPDDEVLGCGGTIARLSDEGHAVHIRILGEGMTSRYASRDRADVAAVAALHTHSDRVARLLGARDLEMAGLPDNRFDTVPLLDVVKIVEAWIDAVKPSCVYTQHGGDLNIDHRVTFRATVTATRPVARCVVRSLYAYAVDSSTEWAFGKFEPIFRPNVFVDISTTLDRKVEALAIYETETREFPHPRSAENLRAGAARWGAAAGLRAAEPFELIRWINRRNEYD